MIHRHPDAVVVVTTNVSYEGCRGVNQSVLDRMNLTQDIELAGAGNHGAARHGHYRL